MTRAVSSCLYICDARQASRCTYLGRGGLRRPGYSQRVQLSSEARKNQVCFSNAVITCVNRSTVSVS